MSIDHNTKRPPFGTAFYFAFERDLLLNDRADVLDQHGYGNRVEAALRNDHVGMFFRRLDKLLVHRLDGRGVLINHRLH